MNVTPIKTHKITSKDNDLFAILDTYLPNLKDYSIVAITSKIVSICEGSLIPIDSVSKRKLIEREADYVFPGKNPHNIVLTLKNNMLISSAGIDESNGNGQYVLWPRDAQKVANNVREYLQKKYKLKHLGVIITDSHSSLLRRGTLGFTIAFSGFKALKNYVGAEDLFKRRLHATKANRADAIAVAAVSEMGEGREQTPIAIVEDLSFIDFVPKNPSKAEISQFYLSLQDDIYLLMLQKTGLLRKK